VSNRGFGILEVLQQAIFQGEVTALKKVGYLSTLLPKFRNDSDFIGSHAYDRVLGYCLLL
jgi:hypothetical protein